MTSDEELIKAVRDLRFAMDLTQRGFAKALGKSYGIVQRYEQTRPPRGTALVAFIRLAKAQGRTDLERVFRTALTESMLKYPNYSFTAGSGEKAEISLEDLYGAGISGTLATNLAAALSGGSVPSEAVIAVLELKPTEEELHSLESWLLALRHADRGLTQPVKTLIEALAKTAKPRPRKRTQSKEQKQNAETTPNEKAPNQKTR